MPKATLEPWAETLDAALQTHFPDQVAALEKGLQDYLRLLQRWNQVYNLTAVRDPTEMIYRHLFDSLVVAPFLRTGRVLDCGTGPGLPGIPLALALPDVEFVLLDSNAKKTRFVRQVVMELGLPNVQVVQHRLQTFASSKPFDTVISRAFSSLAALYQHSYHLCRPGGQLLAMKGRVQPEEMSALPDSIEVQVIHLEVPGLDEYRHLLRMEVA